MENLEQLVASLRRYAERRLDPVFHAADVLDLILETDLDGEEWDELIETFAGIDDATVVAGLGWAVAKHGDRATTPVELRYLLAYLDRCLVHEKVARGCSLLAVSRWLMRLTPEELSDGDILRVLKHLDRCVQEAGGASDRESVVAILFDFIYDLDRVGRSLSTPAHQAVLKLLQVDLAALDAVTERLRAEALEMLGKG